MKAAFLKAAFLKAALLKEALLKEAFLKAAFLNLSGLCVNKRSLCGGRRYITIQILCRGR